MLLIPDEGETRLLTEILDGATVRENWTLKLYQNNYTPVASSSAANFTEATFTGYAAKTLTRTITASTWQAVAEGAPSGAWNPQANVGKSTYGSSAQVFSITGGTAQTIYGYFVVGATSGKVLFAEIFAAPRTLNPPLDTLSFTPAFEFGSGSGT
jgi:hypothetical protein